MVFGTTGAQGPKYPNMNEFSRLAMVLLALGKSLIFGYLDPSGEGVKALSACVLGRGGEVLLHSRVGPPIVVSWQLADSEPQESAARDQSMLRDHSMMLFQSVQIPRSSYPSYQ